MNRSLNYWKEMDEAETAYEAARDKVLYSADAIETYDRDDMVAMLGEASLGDIMNLKQLMLESLRGTRKGDFCARIDLVFERIAAL